MFFHSFVCPYESYSIGIWWVFGNDDKSLKCRQWIAKGYWVINSRAGPRKTSFFHHLPFCFLTLCSGNWATVKHQWIPQPTPPACRPNGWHLISGFSLQEEKHLEHSLKCFLLLCHDAQVSFAPLSLTCIYICLLSPQLDASSGRGWLCFSLLLHRYLASVTFPESSEHEYIDEGILQSIIHSYGKYEFNPKEARIGVRGIQGTSPFTLLFIQRHKRKESP